jgi:hypothetical protein
VSALPGNDAPRSARLQGIERSAAPSVDAAKIAFVQSLAQDHAKPAKAPRRSAAKLGRVECTGDGPIMTCCANGMCCTWLGDGNGPICR